MPKSQSKKTHDLSPVTEARLEKLLSEQTSVILKATDQKVDGVKKDMEQLLADQANVILEAVDEQMDKKMDQKLDPVINKLDAILGEVQKHREEEVIGAEQLRRHEDQLQDHAVRIKNHCVLEKTQASSAQDDRITAPSDSSRNNGPRPDGLLSPRLFARRKKVSIRSSPPNFKSRHCWLANFFYRPPAPRFIGRGTPLTSVEYMASRPA